MSRPFGLSEFLFILSAVRWTIALSLVAMVCGGVIGIVIATMRTARSTPVRMIAASYVQIFQGTPVLMQLFIVYYGVAVLFNVQISPWPAVILAFALYSGAFLGDIWRGSIEAIPKSQWEAARALALRPSAQMIYIILPQAFRISIPPTVGFLVQLIKSTSIAAQNSAAYVSLSSIHLSKSHHTASAVLWGSMPSPCQSILEGLRSLRSLAEYPVLFWASIRDSGAVVARRCRRWA